MVTEARVSVEEAARMATGRRIGPVDTIWLNMDRPENLMVIESVMLLEQTPDWDAVRDVIQTRLVDPYPVFRERPLPPAHVWDLPQWEPDPDFHLDRHIRRHTLRAPGDDATLQRYIDRHLHRPLDRRRPLWEAHFVAGYLGGAAVFFRMHHSLADGIALTRVLLSMTDAAPSGRRRRPPPLPLPGTAGGLPAVARSLVPGSPLDVARLAVRTAQVAKSLLLTRNPPSAVGGQPELRKRVVWSHTYPLDDLKVVGRLSGATLNDVLMSAVAGALHRYQVASGERPVDLTTMVPVNVRPLDRELPRELGNRFALVFFTFPSALAAPLERLAETKRRMDWLKHSPESLMTFGLIMAIGRTVADLERYVVDFFANKAIGVTTNVAGPADVRYLAGTKVTGVLGWVPGSGHHTVGVCIFTYAGSVRVGFRVDAARVRNPQRLLTAFEAELGDLVSLAGASSHADAKPRRRPRRVARARREKARAH